MSDVDNSATYVSPLEDIIINDFYKNMILLRKNIIQLVLDRRTII